MSDHVHSAACFSFTVVELSSQRIGEATTGVWCSVCNLPSAVVQPVAVLIKKFGQESYETDPVAKLMNIHACEECHTIFELPDVPSLIDNRD